jgi:hypothetical protein
MVSELKFVILAHLLKTANFVHFHSSFDSVVEAIVKRLKYPVCTRLKEENETLKQSDMSRKPTSTQECVLKQTICDHQGILDALRLLQQRNQSWNGNEQSLQSLKDVLKSRILTQKPSTYYSRMVKIDLAKEAATGNSRPRIKVIIYLYLPSRRIPSCCDGSETQVSSFRLYHHLMNSSKVYHPIKQNPFLPSTLY